MERGVNIARSQKEAQEWDIRQQVAMTPQERIRASRELRRRAYPPPNKDVRECHAKPKDLDDLPYLIAAGDKRMSDE
jgi:hypothetical protein